MAAAATDTRTAYDQAKDVVGLASDTLKYQMAAGKQAACDSAQGASNYAQDTATDAAARAQQALEPMLRAAGGAHSTAPSGPTEEVRRLLGGLDKAIPDPYQPRHNLVPSRERPEGHYATPPGRTPLQQHLDYFHTDKNGVIYPWETFMALRYLKFAWEPFNSIICFYATLALHLAFSYQTQDSWLPSPLFSILTKNAHRTKHGASSGTYDASGCYIPAKFEEMWARFDSGGRGRLSPWDLATLVWSKADPLGNPFGTLLTALQWALAWWVFHDDSLALRKNDVRGLYDGTAFYRLADRNGNPWYGMAARRDAIKEKRMG